MNLDNPGSIAQKPPYVLFFAMLTIGMGQTVIYAVMPALGRELQLDQVIVPLPLVGIDWQPGKLAITSLSAMTALVFALVAPFWGRLSDRVGRRQVILIGLIGYTVGTFVFNSVAELAMRGIISGVLLWALLLLARIIHAMVMSATFPAASAYMIDITDIRTRAGGLGKMSAANQMGVLLGPVMAATVAFGYLTPLYIQSVLTLTAAVLVYYFLRDSRPQSALDKAKQKVVSGGRKLRMLDPRYRFILPVGFLLYMMQGMAQQTLGFYCEDVVGLDRIASVRYYAFAMMVSSIAMLFSQLVIVQRARMAPATLVKVGLPFCALGYLVIAASTGLLGIFGGMALFGVGVGMAMPGYSSFASLTVDADEQGNLAGITSTIAGMGFVVGPLLGGYVYNYSANAPFAIAGICLSLLALYVMRHRRFVPALESLR